MKTITITDEQYSFLNTLTEKMKDQDNRATAFPLFVIQVDKKEYCNDELAEKIERKGESYGNFCSDCQEKMDNAEEIPEYCERCDPSCFIGYRIIQDFDLTAGVFLTAEACEEHIRLNHYHYINPKSFAVSSWRNPEIQTVIQLLFKLLAKEIPMPYR